MAVHLGIDTRIGESFPQWLKLAFKLRPDLSVSKDEARAALGATITEYSSDYQIGVGNVIELEDAQQRYTADSAAYVNALYACGAAKAAVDRDTGRSLSRF